MKPCAASVWIGYDKRWAQALAVARSSARKHLSDHIEIHGISLRVLREDGIYRRPTQIREGILWDEISDKPMATEFAISRFFIPHLMRSRNKEGRPLGWALFTDCDVLFRSDLEELFNLSDNKFALMCVKHDFTPTTDTKMGGQPQMAYARKLWSSVMLINCDHPSNKKLDLELLNNERGLRLHQFCWLKDDEIGEIDVKWNWLPGVSPRDVNPAIVHFTDGIPDIPGYEDQAYSDEWRREHDSWVNH